MIISASRRTDIPAFYADWFFNRLRAGFVLTRNPVNPHQVSRVNLSPEAVDGIVFWTKNPMPLLDKLDAFKAYAYYFQFTLTAYGADVETALPDKKRFIIPAFQSLSKILGRERVIWRYDPIFFTQKYTLEWHKKAFAALTELLAPYTRQCVFSFLDFYRNTAKNMALLKVLPDEAERQFLLASHMKNIAAGYGLRLSACAESVDLTSLGIERSCCVDGNLLERISGKPVPARKDKNQRAECNCAASVDIGAYNSCLHGCLYCYANYSQAILQANKNKHDKNSPLLLGKLTEDDKVTERKESCFAARQTELNFE